MAMAISRVNIELGESIPPLTPHAVSVSLPTWQANVGYEEGQDWVIAKMKTGYPRFFIHKSIQSLADALIATHGKTGEAAMLFPIHSAAARCKEFIMAHTNGVEERRIRILDFAPKPQVASSIEFIALTPRFSAILYPQEQFNTAKSFWQHSGEGISSRCAEYCHHALQAGQLDVSQPSLEEHRVLKGPRRYRRMTSTDKTSSNHDPSEPERQDSLTNGHAPGAEPATFIEERFGRNLGAALAADAKLAMRRRISGTLTADLELEQALRTDRDSEKRRDVPGFSEDDVYIYPCGMNAIFHAHRKLKLVGGTQQSICFGFPYVDTLKILEKFGPGALFYGHGSAEDLDDLERRLVAGERYLLLICEFPGNPLLKSPDLKRISTLAAQYGFFVVVDETIGTLLNVNVLPYADVVVSSLTKIFSGDCNVMGGSAVLNPAGRHYSALKRVWEDEYEDCYWPEDALFLERNSRDFVSRIARINDNAEAICDLLRDHPQVKEVYYPKFSPTREHYEACRTPHGGYGGLLSATFHSTTDASTFYDNLATAKGPSLGTNFTLSSPYVMLAHYNELDWAASFGVQADLVRFSVGLEDKDELVATFSRALESISKVT